ncbi:lantibiotic dehydratase [Oenococcus oeni]|uniref:lantibiotic dehydratase n=1 Tax=Oenococcus oeni TaxID=1247 RepID=UPI0005104293|nr:lantibiotic dehydratase [Oenococcus oeni]KGI01508.1 hypothetical protein X293_06645 [Oenococcus oeni IOEB_C52]
MHYSIKKSYMVRTPILPEKIFKQTFINSDLNMIDSLINLTDNSVIKEAILVGSPSLYHSLSLLKTEKKSSKRFRRTLKSVARFINRMTSRATPYGLFSIVSFEEDKTLKPTNAVNQHQLHKRITVDYEWLSALCFSLEKNKIVLANLSIRWNALAIDRGDRIVLQYKNGWGYKRHVTGTQQSFLKKIPIVLQIMIDCKNQIKFQQLLELLIKKFTNFSIDQIYKVLKELVESEFLLTDLRPEIVNANDFNNLINKLETMPEMKPLLTKLKHIQVLIEQYGSTSLGDGIEIYQELVEEMKSITKSSSYLKVDLLTTKSNSNPPKLSEIDRAVNCLISMTPRQNRFPAITAFLDMFVEKYGDDRLVPLLEVLEPEQGCGSPYDKQLKALVSQESHEEKIAANQLIAKIEEAILKGSKTVSVKNNTQIKYHSSFSQGFEVFTAQCTDPTTSEKAYRILPNTGSDQIGKAGGRFKTKADQSDIRKSDFLSVELVELFKNRHFLNVAQNVDANEFETVIGTVTSPDKKEVCLDDILVGIDWINDERHFFFESQSLGKRLKFYVTSMINYQNSQIYSSIGRFLLEASMYQVDNPFFVPNLMNNAYKYPYLPELKCGSVIISSRRWNLNQVTLGKVDNTDDTKNAIHNFVKRWHVPELVYLEHGDTRLLLDLNNVYQFNEIGISISKYGSACLSEYLPIYDGFAREYVFSFTPDKLKTNYDIATTDNLMSQTISSVSKDRIFIPGDEWIFFKIYGVGSRILEIITNDLFEFTKLLSNKRLITDHHYLVYKDSGGVHIRIRYRVDADTQPSTLFALINEWSHSLIQKGAVDRIVFDTYQREIERYGGKELIPKIEEVFTVDSEVSTTILQKLTHSKGILLRKMLTISDYLCFLGLDLKKQIQLITPFDNQVNRKVFSRTRRDIHNETGELIADIINRANDTGESKYISNLYVDFEDKNLFLSDNVADSVYLSLIHMHCNRLLISRKNEEKIMYLLGYLLNKAKFFLIKKV